MTFHKKSSFCLIGFAMGIILYLWWTPSESSFVFLARHKCYCFIQYIAFSKDRYCRSQAAHVLCQQNDIAALPALLGFTKDKYYNVRATVAKWSMLLDHTNAPVVLRPLLDDSHPVVLHETLNALRQMYHTNLVSGITNQPLERGVFDLQLAALEAAQWKVFLMNAQSGISP